jgi:hypothetical protein
LQNIEEVATAIRNGTEMPQNIKGDGTPRKLATAISENCYQPELNTLLNGAAHIEETMLPLP